MKIIRLRIARSRLEVRLFVFQVWMEAGYDLELSHDRIEKSASVHILFAVEYLGVGRGDWVRVVGGLVRGLSVPV